MRLFLCAVALLALSCVSAKACEGYMPVDPVVVPDAPIDPAAVSFAPVYSRAVFGAPLFAANYGVNYGVGYGASAVVLNRRALVVRRAPLVVVRNRRARVVVVH